MRRWFVLFLIALLPARGWAAEAMASEMAGHQLVRLNWAGAQAGHAHSSAELADSPHTAPHAAPKADCHGLIVPAQAGHMPAGGDNGGDSASHGCAFCVNCQACYPLVLALSTPVVALLFSHFNAPPTSGTWFVSAFAQRGFKPPIS
jgi:hypothetical protein